MRKLVVIAVLTGVLLGLTAAHEGETHNASSQTDTVKPGVVTPDSSLYGLEVAWDSVAVSLGLTTAGDVVQERAAEAQAMAEKGDTEAMQRAVDDLTKVAQKATAEDLHGIETAEVILDTLMETASTETQTGLQTAIEGLHAVQDHAAGGEQDQSDDHGAGPGDVPMSVADCEGKPHAACVGHWEIQNSQCAWICEDVSNDSSAAQ